MGLNFKLPMRDTRRNLGTEDVASTLVLGPEQVNMSTFPVQPSFTCPAQGKTREYLIGGQEQEGTFLEEELKDI